MIKKTLIDKDSLTYSYLSSYFYNTEIYISFRFNFTEI